MSNWRSVWNHHFVNYDIFKSKDTERIFLELKRSSGFDVVGDGISYSEFLKQYNETKNILSLYHEITSVYEVGCGSGENLFLFEQYGLFCGGVDYSQELVKAARQVLLTEDILCEEALYFPRYPQYDAGLSNSVFSYFPDTSYAVAVLEKMYQNAAYSIGILDIHDLEKEAEFLAYRKAMISNYEDWYKNLPKLFYEKCFFIDFAEKHHMNIRFTENPMEGYWNSGFIFNCYLFKN